MRLTNSNKYLERARKFIPAQSQTFSKAPKYFVEGVYPVYLNSGKDAWISDVDGNEFIDFLMGLGAVTLGYNYEKVNDAIINQLSKGIIFSLPHPLEVEVAELLISIIPCAEMVRFSKTGSEVCSAAVKAARAYTGREHVAYCGYHGWHDWYSVSSDKPKGIPKSYRNYIHQFTYNDISTLELLFNAYYKEIACVIMEPVTFTLPKDDFLQRVKDLCRKHGTVLIFDEMVTGFRIDIGGAQKYFGVTPDLATFGKGMANGMPLAAVVGRKDIMKEFEDVEGGVFFSTTFGGETLSLAAAKATIREMLDNNVQDWLANCGARLMGTGKLIKGIEFSGHPSRPLLVMENETQELRSLLMQELVKRGMLTHSSALNFCYTHTTNDIYKLVTALDESMSLIREGKVKLEGKMAKMSFRRL